MPLPPDERRCTATGKDGERCRAWRSASTGDAGLCSGHGGLGLAASREAAAAAARQSAENRQEQVEARPRSYREALQRRWEENADAFVAVRVEIALDPTVDPGVRLRAIESGENRVYGKAKETVEQVNTQRPSTLDELYAMTREERLRLLAELNASPLRVIEGQGS